MEETCQLQCYDDVCDPIRSIDQLLNKRQDVLRWCELVEPLAERCRPRSFYDKYFSMDSSSSFEVDSNRAEVLVCHDYKGNYLDDKFINGTIKWEEYRFYNWNAIDWFCYFSHNLVTIPTLSFLNAAHRNGVKVMGTVIVEGEDGRRILHDDILGSKERVEEVVEALVDISKQLHFEGWLLNIEVAVDAQSIPLLKHFVDYLTIKMHEKIEYGKVIWYDSVTDDGHLWWQNELNDRNETFFNLCDGIFTNYNWNIKHLERTSKLIMDKYPDRRQDVYFGIDVFGRGQVAGFKTHETLSKSAAFTFSTAIFAPAWTCETINLKIGFEDLAGDGFRDRYNDVFLERNDRFWCSMYRFLHLFGPKQLPFVSNFCIGSGKRFYRLGAEVKKNWFNLKLQSFQPSTPSEEGFYSRYYEDAFDGGSCLSLTTHELFRLFVCDLSCDEDIIFSYTFKCQSEGDEDLQVNLNIQNIHSGLEGQIICNGPYDNPFSISCLSDHEAKSIIIHLARNRYATVPVRINGWRTRYYLLKFDKGSKFIITDIGVKKVGTRQMLLGALSLYSAKNLQENFSHIQQIAI